MIRVKLLNAIDESIPRELWFSTPEKADEYLIAARVKNPDLDYERDDLNELTEDLVDPEPPKVARFYTAMWRADTQEDSIAHVLVGVEHADDLPALAVSTIDVMDALHPLTRARWAHLAGVYRMVSVTGLDKQAVKDELERTLRDLRAQGKLLDSDAVAEVLAENQEEYESYVWPIDKVRARINGLSTANFLGINTVELAVAGQELFELLYDTDRVYEQKFAEMGYGNPPPHPAGRPLDIAVQAAAGFDAVSDSMIFGAVRAERTAGASWQDIAAPLGITRQAAQFRYADRLGRGSIAITDLYLVAKSIRGDETTPVHWFGRMRASITAGAITGVIGRLAPGSLSVAGPIIENFLKNDDVLLSGVLAATVDGRSLHLMRERR